MWLVLPALVILAYLPVLIYGGFIWDDDMHVTANINLRSADGLRDIWMKPDSSPQYYPMVHTIFWLEYRLFGQNPAGYHVVNVILHIANAMLVWIILRQLKVPAAELAAILFAVHPVEVESVAWITELKNVLSGLFYLLALSAYLKFAGKDETTALPSPAAGQITHGRWRYYALTLLLFACALLSKTVACSLPVVILLLTWWKYGRIKLIDWLLTLPMLIGGAALGLNTARIEYLHVQAHGVEWSYTILDRCLIAGRAFWFYATKIAAPLQLTFVYPKWTIDSAAVWQYLFPLGLVALLVALFAFQKKIGRAPLTAALVFLVTLFPSLGFFNIYPMRYTLVADHYQYMASIAFITLAASLLWLVIEHIPASNPAFKWAFLSAPVLVLAALTYSQGTIYFDEITLWKDTIQKNPTCWMAYNNLTHIADQKGDRDAAFQLAMKSYQINPNISETLNNLGYAFMLQQRLDVAIPLLQKATVVNPKNAAAWNCLGAAWAAQHDLASAQVAYARAIELQKDYDQPIYNSGLAYLAEGKGDLAAARFQMAVDFYPEWSEARERLGVALAMQGKFTAAIEQLQNAIRQNSRNPEFWRDLADICHKAGRQHEATVALDHANALSAPPR